MGRQIGKGAARPAGSPSAWEAEGGGLALELPVCPSRPSPDVLSCRLLRVELARRHALMHEVSI